LAREGEIGVGFVAPESVMQVSGMKDEAQFPAAISKGAEERHGIRTAG
jgi:hypothetical protein